MEKEEQKKAIEDFFKEAFRVDGSVDFMSAKEAEEVLRGAAINVIRLNDSKRGTFYLARVVPR